MEVATAQAAPAATPPPSAPSSAASAPSQSNGAGATAAPPQWYNDFKNEDLKGYVSKKGFQTTEALAESYKNLEAKLSTRVSEDKMIILPEKMEGDALKGVFQKLGTPKEAKEYALPRDEKGSDVHFLDWAEKTFFENNLTKAQADGVVAKYNEFAKSLQATQQQEFQLKIQQADTNLKKEWGARYDENVNLAKQGAKVLGLDQQTLDLMEARQGRDVLFKNLQRIGVSVGEANFVDGQTSTPTQMTPEQAQAEIKNLINDQKFAKKVAKGDAEATAKWNELNRLAAPGEKQVR